MGQPTAGKKIWSADFTSDSDSPLADQLAAVERFLADKITVLEELAPTCRIWLFTSWTPKVGQDHAVLSPTLIKLLGRIGADVTIDTWTGSEHGLFAQVRDLSAVDWTIQREDGDGEGEESRTVGSARVTVSSGASGM